MNSHSMPLVPPEKLPPRGSSELRTVFPYVPGIDGLRALAILAVLIYHAETGILPGGYLGVEVFFVISGYLITCLLMAEYQNNLRLHTFRFWYRRARRLLPALFVLLVSVLAFSTVVLPDEVASLRADAFAATGYLTNWYLILSQKSYFESIGRPSLFQHLWSLAVEEQFYLLWPLVLPLILRLPRRWAVLLLLAGALASLSAMMLLYQPDGDPSRVYYGTDTRAAGLLIGAIVAILWFPTTRRLSKRRARILDGLGLGALAMLGLAFLRLDEFQPWLYRGGLIFVDIATAILIVAVTHGETVISRIMKHPLLVWLGLRSYSLYLWHWPVFMLTRPELDVPVDGPILWGIRLVLSLTLADLSYRLIEMPVRSGMLGRILITYRTRQVRRTSLGFSWMPVLGILVFFSLVLGDTVMSAEAPTPPPYASELMDAAPPSAFEQNTPTPADESIRSGDLMSSFEPEASLTAAPFPRAPTPTVTVAPTATQVASTPSGSGTVLALGDSVMLGASLELQNAIPNVEIDAGLGRQVSAQIGDLQARRAASKFAHTVILHVGNNGPISPPQFGEMMQMLEGHRVVVLNVRVARPWEGTNNAMLGQEIRNYPYAVLVDWHAASADHPDYFWKDGVHLRPAGARVYASLIAAAVQTP